MPALTDLSDIIHRGTGGSDGNPESLFFFKDTRIDAAAAPSLVAGRMHSLWRYNGIPAGGVIPGAAEIPINTTQGGLLQTNPGGTPQRQKWLLGWTGCNFQTGTLILYDRLLHCGGLSGTVTTAQTVGGTLTRNTGGLGNQIWVEIYTPLGTTATTITASYTNELGTAGRTTVATTIGGADFNGATRLIPLPLASGDRGVRAVASVTVLASTGIVGNFGVTIAGPIGQAPIGAMGVGFIRDYISGLPAIPEIVPNACLAFAWVAQGTSAPQLQGMLMFVEK
jgi:hypothetical protein